MASIKKTFLAAAFMGGCMLFGPGAALADANCDAAEKIVFGDQFAARAAEALPLAEACRTADPANGLWLKGLTLEKLGKLEDAIVAFDEMLVLEPKFSGGWSQRGGVKYHLKRFDAALIDYNQAIALEKKADYYVARGNVYDDTGKKDLAMADYTTAVSLEPNNAYIYRERSVAYNVQKNYTAALADAQKAVELDPANVRGYILRADNYWALDRRQEGYNDYLRYASYDQSRAYVWNRLGAYLYDTKDYANSIIYYNKALDLDPSNVAYLVDRANSKDDSKDTAGAMADYNKALSLDPNYARGYFDRGLSLERQGKKAEAIADYTKAVTLDPSDTSAKQRLDILTGAAPKPQ